MSAYTQAIEYVVQKVLEEWKDNQYNTDDITDVIHAELDYYCSSMYYHEADDIIVSYGLTKALQEYDNQFGDCPKDSLALLYVIMMETVQEKIVRHIENEKKIAMRRAVWNEEKKTLEYFDVAPLP